MSIKHVNVTAGMAAKLLAATPTKPFTPKDPGTKAIRIVDGYPSEIGKAINYIAKKGYWMPESPQKNGKFAKSSLPEQLVKEGIAKWSKDKFFSGRPAVILTPKGKKLAKEVGTKAVSFTDAKKKDGTPKTQGKSTKRTSPTIDKPKPSTSAMKYLDKLLNPLDLMVQKKGNEYRIVNDGNGKLSGIVSDQFVYRPRGANTKTENACRRVMSTMREYYTNMADKKPNQSGSKATLDRNTSAAIKTFLEKHDYKVTKTKTGLSVYDDGEKIGSISKDLKVDGKGRRAKDIREAVKQATGNKSSHPASRGMDVSYKPPRSNKGPRRINGPKTGKPASSKPDVKPIKPVAGNAKAAKAIEASALPKAVKTSLINTLKVASKAKIKCSFNMTTGKKDGVPSYKLDITVPKPSLNGTVALLKYVTKGVGDPVISNKWNHGKEMKIKGLSSTPLYMYRINKGEIEIKLFVPKD